MSVESALIKILEGERENLGHFLSAFPTQLLLRVKLVKGVAAGATDRVEYIGYAPSDSTLAQPRWLIKKNVYDATGFQTDAVFAGGALKFNKVFDSGATEYTGYTYSTT